MDARRRSEHQAFFAETPMPELLPPYSLLRVDSEGNLWVAGYRVPGEENNDWSVFDTRGRWLGDVGLPEGLSVLDIGGDYLLGGFTDDLDVEHLVLYELIKG